MARERRPSREDPDMDLMEREQEPDESSDSEYQSSDEEASEGATGDTEDREKNNDDSEAGDGQEDGSSCNSSSGGGESMSETAAKKETKKVKKAKKVHKLSIKKTEDFNAKLRKRGVVYVSRVPPKMTPTKIKTLLSELAEVTRVYLVEEDASNRKRRKANGGSGRKRYVEGWVEFASKKKAKRIAMCLNTTPIETHKRSPHYGDLWSLKYLPKFKWSHLTEKVAYERRVREQKLRIEMMQARRENAAYAQMVETGKKLDHIEERKRKRGDDDRPSRSKHWQTKPFDDRKQKPAKSAVLEGLV